MDRPVIRHLRLLFACMNIPTKVGPAAWARCFRLLAERAEFFGINEAGSIRAKRLYRKLAKALGLTSWGLWRGTNPIFWDPDILRFIRGRQIKLHSRGTSIKAKLWPGFNAARYVTEVVFRHIAARRIIAVLNVHLVAPGPKVPSRWRARKRAQSLARIRLLVAAHAALGRIVVLIGDTNIVDDIDIPGMVWLFPEGVDKLAILVPEGMTLADFDVEQFDAPTDHHHGRAADVTLDLIGAAA